MPAAWELTKAALLMSMQDPLPSLLRDEQGDSAAKSAQRLRGSSTSCLADKDKYYLKKDLAAPVQAVLMPQVLSK